MKVGIMFFAGGGKASQPNKYKLLLEATQFADRHNFHSVSTPERHFDDFGGLFPNPSVTGAALAVLTKNIQIRAGILIAPLHDPLRIAEEWSVVDNLANGRAGIAFGPGRNPNDFLLCPDNYEKRQAVMYEQIETLRRLWRGEAIMKVNGVGVETTVSTYPRPIQPEIPIWITTLGSTASFAKAGAIGANLLTHLSGQDIPTLAEKIEEYRQARADSGFDAGIVTLMQHTFIGTDDDRVRAKVWAPVRDYLQTAVRTKLHPDQDNGSITEDEINSQLDAAFESYYATGSLLGTPTSCLNHLRQLEKIGVDEVGCLIDFVDDCEAVMDSLQHLNELRMMVA